MEDAGPAAMPALQPLLGLWPRDVLGDDQLSGGARLIQNMGIHLVEEGAESSSENEFCAGSR